MFPQYFINKRPSEKGAVNLRCLVFHHPILCLVTQLCTVHARKQQIYAQNSMEKLPWMEKYLWTNTRIISIICHKWWKWCLFYERAKIKTLKYFSIHIVGEFALDEYRTLHGLDFGFLSSFFSWKTFFFPKFELLNSGCGLSTSAAYLRVFTRVVNMIWLFLNNPECLQSERSTDKINLLQTLPLAISMLKLMRVRHFSSTSA